MSSKFFYMLWIHIVCMSLANEIKVSNICNKSKKLMLLESLEIGKHNKIAIHSTSCELKFFPREIWVWNKTSGPKRTSFTTSAIQDFFQLRRNITKILSRLTEYIFFQSEFRMTSQHDGSALLPVNPSLQI